MYAIDPVKNTEVNHQSLITNMIKTWSIRFHNINEQYTIVHVEATPY